MGGNRWNKKVTVEQCKAINTSLLRDHGFFSGLNQTGVISWTRQDKEIGSIGIEVSTSGMEGEIHFRYTQTDQFTSEKTNLDYATKLVATSCHYGGKRWWFVCPLRVGAYQCEKRVLKLYFGGGKYLGCRHCHNLTYESVQEHDKRIDRLVKNPELVIQLLKSPGLNFLALKAALRLGYGI